MTSFVPSSRTRNRVNPAFVKCIQPLAADKYGIPDKDGNIWRKRADGGWSIDRSAKNYQPKTNAEIAAAAQGKPAPSPQRMEQLARRVDALSKAELSRVARGDEAGYEKAKGLYAKAQDAQLTAVAAKAQAVAAPSSVMPKITPDMKSPPQGMSHLEFNAVRSLQEVSGDRKKYNVRLSNILSSSDFALETARLRRVAEGLTGQPVAGEGRKSVVAALENPGWSDAARAASLEVRQDNASGKPSPKAAKVKAAVQAVAGKPAPTGADLAKKLAANEKRSASMKARAALKGLEKAAVAKAQSDDRYSNTGRAAADAKAIAEAKTKVASPRKPSATARRNALQTTVDTALAEAAKLRAAEAEHRAGKYWDRANSAARGAEAAELRARVAQRDLAAIPARGKKAPSVTSASPAATSGLRGTQNAANLAAIIENRQANAVGEPKPVAAKPTEKLPPIVGPETPHEKMAKAGTLPKGENAWIAKQVVDLARDGRGSIGRRVGMEAYKTLVRTTGSNEAARAEIRAVMGKKAPAGGMFASGMTTDAPAKAPAAKPRSKTSKAMGVLAPIGLGVAMLAASNQAKAAGADAKGQLKAAAKEGVATGAHMAGFMAGTTAATMGLMKAGLTAARAVPAVSAALMAGGAVHGALTAKPDERLAGAAKGAWDMSLPGMIVNTAVAAKGAVSGRLSSEQAMEFSNRNEAYAAERPAAEDGPGGGPRGFANPANQRSAQEGRGVQNITEWAQGATPQTKSKMGPR